MTDLADFDGCGRKCRLVRKHMLTWGECEHAPKPEPTVSLSKIFQDTDGYPSIGYDNYTVQGLADLIEPALRNVQVRLGPNALAMLQRGETIGLSGGEYADLAREAAYAIVHRNDPAYSNRLRLKEHQTCDTCGAAYKMGVECSTCTFRKQMDAEVAAVARTEALKRAASEAMEAAALFEGDEDGAVAAGALEGLADRFQRMSNDVMKGDAQMVAYRAPGLDVLYCTLCRPADDRFVPVDSSDLPDGGICANCDMDILIQASQDEAAIIKYARRVGLVEREKALGGSRPE